MNNALFSIGDIVALKSHPYTKNQQNIIISGDSLSLSPLMVVGEVQVFNNKAFMNENKVSEIRYKCHWFSSKSYEFKDYLFTEDQLKLVCAHIANIVPQKLKRGISVYFKTGNIELRKQKASFSTVTDKKQIGEDNVLINPLLSYLPPILQIIDIVKNVSQTSVVNKKNTPPQRVIPFWNVKCLYFDVQNSKAKEIALPLEAFEIHNPIAEDLIDLVVAVIKKSSYFLVERAKEFFFVKPYSISNKYGNYYVRAYNYLTNTFVEINLSNSIKLIAVEDIFTEQHPKINIESNKELPSSGKIFGEISKALAESQKKKLYARITYRNKHDEVTVRTIRDYTLINLKENDSDIVYLVGHCLLRNAERHFRIDRIESLQILDLSFE